MSSVFRTQYDPHDRYYTDPGDPWQIEYELQLDKKTGVPELVPTGKTYIPEMIDSYRESCDIHNIINAYKNGDVDALNHRAAFYADVTEFPKTYAEMFSRVQEGTNFFNSLPTDIKEKFNNDPAQFFAKFGTPEFNAVFNQPVAAEAAPEVVESEVKDEQIN